MLVGKKRKEKEKKEKLQLSRAKVLLFFRTRCSIAVFGLTSHSSLPPPLPPLSLTLSFPLSIFGSLQFLRENPGNLLAYPVITSIMLRGVLATALRAAYAPSPTSPCLAMLHVASCSATQATGRGCGRFDRARERERGGGRSVAWEQASAK